MTGTPKTWDVTITPLLGTDGAPRQLLVRTVEVAAKNRADGPALTERGQDYQRLQRVADVFQKASLPQSLPDIDNLTFHAVYAPAESDVRLGGDWYDAFPLPDGRVAVSVGDVCGSGLNAAVIMGKMRQTMRSVGMLNQDPALMLDTTDRMLKLDHPDNIVTALVGILDPITRTLVWASAGHLGPLFRYADGTIFEGMGCGLPLGLRGDDEMAPQSVLLPHGSMLMFYTDGLIESTHDLAEGERRLRAALSEAKVLESANPAKLIHEMVLYDGSHDDVAILIVSLDEQRRDDAPRWTFDTGDVVAAQGARHAFLDYVQAIGGVKEQCEAIELVFGEIVGNVHQHAPGFVEIDIESSESEIVLHVCDRGRGFKLPNMVQADMLSEGGRGLFLAAAFSRELHVTPSPGGGSHVRAVLPLMSAAAN